VQIYRKNKKMEKENMKHLQTFESFVTDASRFEKLDEGIFGDLKDRVVGWFGKMKDAAMQKTATVIAKQIEQKKNDPAVKRQIAEIQKAYAKLSDADKNQFQSLFGSRAAIEKTGERLEAAGVEQMMEAIEESVNTGEPLNESKLVGKIIQGLGISTSLGSIIIMCIGFITNAGGYITLSFAEGMPAGIFAAIGCAVLLAGGIVSYIGTGIAGEAGWGE